MHGNLRVVPTEKLVLAHGCFDVLHLGHIRHLQEAKAQGDRLVVSVTADAHVGKGLGRPIHTADQRIEALKALDCVDDAFVSDSADAVDVIDRIKPAVYVKGIDYAESNDEALARETLAATRHGGRLHITRSEKFSSSRLINADRFPDSVSAYLRDAVSRGFHQHIVDAFERADRLRIAFVGETIVDEYRYVHALGKPSKEFILATVEHHREDFLGGISAAAQHAEWPLTTVVSADSPVVKTRYVDGDFTKKLFEVYNTRKIELHPSERDRFQCKLIEAVRDNDVVVVMDFGHGLMDSRERHVVETAKFLAVNAQTNAGNCGFNPVTAYKKADLVCVDDPEARLAAGMQDADIRAVVWHLSCRIKSQRFVVTHGRHGSLAYCSDDSERFSDVPAFAIQGVDTMGCGDAFLATAAPLVAAGLDLEMAAFAGNVAGAIKASIVGHRRHVQRAELMQTIGALLA